jgi:hypothetical protein
MARAMASPLRVKNTAYFDIAAIASTNGHLGSLHRPLVGGYAPNTRPTPARQASRPSGRFAGEENGAGWASSLRRHHI